MKNNIIITVIALLTMVGTFSYLSINNDSQLQMPKNGTLGYYSQQGVSTPIYKGRSGGISNRQKKRAVTMDVSSSMKSVSPLLQSTGNQTKTKSYTDTWEEDVQSMPNYGFYKNREIKTPSVNYSGANLAYESGIRSNNSAAPSQTNHYGYAKISTVSNSSGKQLSGGFNKLAFDTGDDEDDFEEGAGNDNNNGYNDVAVGGGILLLLLMSALYLGSLYIKNRRESPVVS